MPKGMFTQGMCLLTDGQTTIEDIKSALEAAEFEVVKEVSPHEHWAFNGPSIVVSFLPEVNGYAVVDVVNHAWPDKMGDPKTDWIIFGAWVTGNFGPFSFLAV